MTYEKSIIIEYSRDTESPGEEKIKPILDCLALDKNSGDEKNGGDNFEFIP